MSIEESGRQNDGNAKDGMSEQVVEVVLVSCREKIDAGCDGSREDGTVFLNQDQFFGKSAGMGVADDSGAGQQGIQSGGVAGTHDVRADLMDGIRRRYGSDAAQIPELEEAIGFAVRRREQYICVEVDAYRRKVRH